MEKKTEYMKIGGPRHRGISRAVLDMQDERKEESEKRIFRLK
jgi:hypothetical protein